MPAKRRVFAALVAILALAGCEGQAATQPPPDTQPEDVKLGLFTTLPIFWGETTDMAAMLDQERPQGWVRRTLEQTTRIEPLDTLERTTLGGLERVLLAQPRVLSPDENVALDNWVRDGGRALIFADPMLTRETSFTIGDKRRPQDVVMLSPLLTHWGLALEFLEDEPDREHIVQAFGGAYPVWLAGRLQILPEAQDSDCTLAHDGLVADCRIGKGRALMIADAALLDGEGEVGEARSVVLKKVVAQAFD